MGGRFIPHLRFSNNPSCGNELLESLGVSKSCLAGEACNRFLLSILLKSDKPCMSGSCLYLGWSYLCVFGHSDHPDLSMPEDHTKVEKSDLK